MVGDLLNGVMDDPAENHRIYPRLPGSRGFLPPATMRAW
jgi:hypothetical protein